MSEPNVRDIRAQLVEALRMSGLSAESRRKRDEKAARWARRLPDGNLTTGEYQDADWHFCEALADRIRDEYPNEACRLYELARQSYIVDGYSATGSGEGLQSVADRERVDEKLRDLGRLNRNRHEIGRQICRFVNRFRRRV